MHACIFEVIQCFEKHPKTSEIKQSKDNSSGIDQTRTPNIAGSFFFIGKSTNQMTKLFPRNLVMFLHTSI